MDMGSVGGNDMKLLFPSSWRMWHNDSKATVGSVMVSTHDASADYGHWARQNPAADGDTFTQNFYCAAGTYTLYVLTHVSTDRGKLDWYIDNEATAQIVGMDLYGGFAYNVFKTGTLTIKTDGWHKLRGVINGKNASSSGYMHISTAYWLRQSAD